MTGEMLVAGLCLLLVILVGWIVWRFCRPYLLPSSPNHHTGSPEELDDLVARLMKSTREGAFLIVQVEHGDDFLQMTGGSSGVQIDFPLVTERQKGFELKIRRSAAHQGLRVVENYGTDGSRFLDIDIHDGPGRIAAVCRELMGDIYGTPRQAKFRYTYDRLEPKHGS